MSKLEKLSDKFKLTEKEIRSIFAQEHMLRHFYPKKDLTNIDILFKGDSLDHINKICKALKVSKDAVVGGIMYERIKERK